MLLHLRQRQLDFLIDIFQAKSPSVEKSPACHKESSDSSLLATKRKNLAGHRIADEALLPYFRASLELISYTCQNLFRCTVQFYWHFSSCQYLVLITENLNADSLFFFFFQNFEIWPILVRVDYSPSHVCLAALRGGNYVELVNLVPWKVNFFTFISYPSCSLVIVVL